MKMKKTTLWDSVVEISDQIHNDRKIQDVFMKTMEEIGELSQEIMIHNGTSYKKPGSDGVSGEAIDVLNCIIDLIHVYDPSLTEKDIATIARVKQQKWLSATKNVIQETTIQGKLHNIKASNGIESVPKKKIKPCTCGFIIVDANEDVLLCHTTNSYNNWDIPKGIAEDGEDHLDAAIRELYEETGIVIDDRSRIEDYGQHEYIKGKDLHLYLVHIDSVPLSHLMCSSMVRNSIGPDFPEVDDYRMISIPNVTKFVCKSLKTYIDKYFMQQYLKGEFNV